eukprot:TRINITY_DN13774_c0_g1_i1.p1 TRINITY_DN13774_c0_g1~~TRINITY_DN13774_c0_g1_i1.p1  ORF type:complete len:1519 (+),score=349.42 TRINITY_DN13774_c0_g1_i1:79-4635(+)
MPDLLATPRSAVRQGGWAATEKRSGASDGRELVARLDELLRTAKVQPNARLTPQTKQAAAEARTVLLTLSRRSDVPWAGEHHLERSWYHLLLRSRENGCGKSVIQECVKEGLATCRTTWSAKWGSSLPGAAVSVLSPCRGIPQVFSTIVNNFLAEEGVLLAEEIEEAKGATQADESMLPPSDATFSALWQKQYKKVRRARAWAEYHWTLDGGMIYYRLKLAQVLMSFGISAPSAAYAVGPVKDSLKQLAKCGSQLKARPLSFIAAAFNAFFMQAHELWKAKMAVLHDVVGRTAGVDEASGEPEKFNHLKEVLEVHFNAFSRAVQDPEFVSGRPYAEVHTFRLLSLACYDAILTHGLKLPSRSANILRHYAQQTYYQGDEQLHVWTQSLLYRSGFDERTTAGAAHAVAASFQELSLESPAAIWMGRAYAAISDSEVSLHERSLLSAAAGCGDGAIDGMTSTLQALAGYSDNDPRIAELEIVGRTQLTKAMLRRMDSEAAVCCGEEVLNTFFRTDPLLCSYSRKLNNLAVLHQVFSLTAAHCDALMVRGEASTMDKILAQAIKLQASSHGSFSAVHTASILFRRGQGLLLAQKHEDAASSLRAGLTILNYVIPSGCCTALKLDCMLAYTDALLGLRKTDLALSNIDKAEKILLPELLPEAAAASRNAPWAAELGPSIGLHPITAPGTADVVMTDDPDIDGVDQLLSQYSDVNPVADLFDAKTPSTALAKRSTTGVTGLKTTKPIPIYESYEASVLAKKGQCLVACGTRRGGDGADQVGAGRALLERCANTLDNPREKAKAHLALAKLHPRCPDWHIPRPRKAVPGERILVSSPASQVLRDEAPEDVRHLQEALLAGGALNGPAMNTKTLSLELTRRLGRKNEIHAAHYLNVSQGWTVKHQLEGLATRRRIDATTFKGDWSAPPGCTWAADPETNILKLQALLPSSCVVITLSENADGYLVVGRIEADTEPLILGISECDTHIKDAQKLLHDALAAAKEHVSSVDKTRLHDADYKQDWWDKRDQFDGQIKEVVENLGDRILGGWRGAMLGLPLTTDVRGRLEELTSHFAEKLEALTPAHSQVEIDRRMLLLLISSVPNLHDGLRVDAERKKTKTSSLYWRGTTSLIRDALYDLLEAKPDRELAAQVRDIAREIHEEVARVIPPSATCVRQHVLLVAGDLHRLPWEACSALDGEPVSRIPSLSFLMNKLENMSCAEFLCRSIDPSKLFYVLNPDGNLKKTEQRFCDFLTGRKGWRGQIGCLPGTVIAGPSVSSQPPADPNKEVAWRQKWIDIYRRGLVDYDVFVYMGHGTGEQFVPAKEIKGLGHSRAGSSYRAGGLPVTPKSTRAHRLSGSRPPPMSPFAMDAAQTPRQLTFNDAASDEESPDVRVPSTRRRARLPSQAVATPGKTPQAATAQAAKVPGAVTFLMGCSSGCLTEAQGELESAGTPLAFLIAGAPAVVANLWDVTDGEIDRFTSHVLEKWMPDPSAIPLTDVLHSARKQVKLRYLIGACPVVYGLPINPRLG